MASCNPWGPKFKSLNQYLRASPKTFFHVITKSVWDGRITHAGISGGPYKVVNFSYKLYSRTTIVWWALIFTHFLFYILSIHHLFHLLNVDINKKCDITLEIIDIMFTKCILMSVRGQLPILCYVQQQKYSIPRKSND